MAKLKLSSFAARLSGKAGNAVYKWTKEGVILVDRELPANPQTAAQLAVRGAFTKIAHQWKPLSATQKDEWNAYAEASVEREGTTGRQFNLTGFNWFVKLGAKFYAVNAPGATAPTAPPATEYTGDGITIAVTSEPGSITFTASGPNASTSTTELCLQRLRSEGSKPSKGGYRIKGYKKFAAGSLSVSYPVRGGFYSPAFQFVNTATGQEAHFTALQAVEVEPSAGGARKRAA